VEKTRDIQSEEKDLRAELEALEAEYLSREK